MVELSRRRTSTFYGEYKTPRGALHPFYIFFFCEERRRLESRKLKVGKCGEHTGLEGGTLLPPEFFQHKTGGFPEFGKSGPQGAVLHFYFYVIERWRSPFAAISGVRARRVSSSQNHINSIYDGCDMPGC